MAETTGTGPQANQQQPLPSVAATPAASQEAPWRRTPLLVPLLVAIIVLIVVLILVAIKYLAVDTPNDKTLTVVQEPSRQRTSLEEATAKIATSDSRLAGCWEEARGTKWSFTGDGDLIVHSEASSIAARYSYNATHLFVVESQGPRVGERTYRILPENILVVDSNAMARCADSEPATVNSKAAVTKCYAPLLSWQSTCCADLNNNGKCDNREDACAIGGKVLVCDSSSTFASTEARLLSDAYVKAPNPPAGARQVVELQLRLSPTASLGPGVRVARVELLTKDGTCLFKERYAIWRDEQSSWDNPWGWPSQDIPVGVATPIALLNIKDTCALKAGDLLEGQLAIFYQVDIPNAKIGEKSTTSGNTTGFVRATISDSVWIEKQET